MGSHDDQRRRQALPLRLLPAASRPTSAHAPWSPATTSCAGEPAEIEGTDEIVARLQDIAAAGPGDRSATKLLAETSNYLGAGLANLINLFNPERIVIGGWLRSAAHRPAAARHHRDRVAEHALKLPFSQVSIVPAELGTDAVALGAATLPISEFLVAGAVPNQRSADQRTRRAATVRASRG